jgi:hypothetical protein
LFLSGWRKRSLGDVGARLNGSAEPRWERLSQPDPPTHYQGRADLSNRQKSGALGDCGRIILPPSPRKGRQDKPRKPVFPSVCRGSAITSHSAQPRHRVPHRYRGECERATWCDKRARVCVVAAGSIGLVLSRKFWRRPEVVHQVEPELGPGETSIAAAPM